MTYYEYISPNIYIKKWGWPQKVGMTFFEKTQIYPTLGRVVWPPGWGHASENPRLPAKLKEILCCEVEETRSPPWFWGIKLEISESFNNSSIPRPKRKWCSLNCTSGYLYVAAFGGTAVLNPWKSRVGRWFISFLWPGLFFRECIIANICQCQWIFLMKPRLFRLGTFWSYCRWIHLLSIPMVNLPVYWLQMIEMNMRPTSSVFHNECSMRFWNI